MSSTRRQFLKATPAAAAAAAYAAQVSAQKSSTPAVAKSARIGDAAYQPVRDYPIQPVSYADVRLTDAFWKPRVDRNAAVTIPFETQKLAGTGARGLQGGVLEAAILSLKTHPNASLQKQVDGYVESIREPQGNSGFEIASTYFKVTGRRDLLDPSIRAAAALYESFATKNPPFSGGERDSLNCAQLYRVTHDKKHLDLAKHYLDIRGLENSVNRSRHNQSYKPVLEQSEAVGHAVNCVTLMLSMADVGVMTGLRPYLDAAKRMWADAAERKMYITGGVGTTGNEGFGAAYSLPNISAYAETCAVLMFMTLSQRLFMATGDAKYIDVMERGMYNNAVDGVSQSGDEFFYVNRLASAGDGRDLRWKHASLECCPPNLVRFFASMPGYIYAQDAAGSIFVNLYVSSEAAFNAAGRGMKLTTTSEMPWNGKTKIAVSSGDGSGAIKLRIPGWARNRPVPSALYAYSDRSDKAVAIAVNGARVAAVADALGYVTINRRWKTGDVIDIDFPMSIRRVTANAKVKENRGRVAIERGPIVYCAESHEAAGGKALDIVLPATAELRDEIDQKLFGGATVIRTSARSMTNPSAAPTPLTLIPYSLWANRGAGEMATWLPAGDYELGDVGPSGGFIFYKNPNFAKDGWRFLEAAPFDQSAGAHWGCFRQLIPGARSNAVGDGKQNTTDMLASCSERGSAADLCANLSINGVRGWFLPSRDELSLMYKNLHARGLGDFHTVGNDNFTYWASSQQTADMSAHVDFADLGRQHGDDKDFPRRVRAVRAF